MEGKDEGGLWLYHENMFSWIVHQCIYSILEKYVKKQHDLLVRDKIFLQACIIIYLLSFMNKKKLIPKTLISNKGIDFPKINQK